MARKPTPQSDIRFKLVGIGGAGGNAAAQMAGGLAGVELVAINTDLQALSGITGAEKLQIPVETTRVQLQLSSQRFSRLWARAKELHEPIQPGSAICGDRLLLRVGASAALRGHGVLCAAVDGMAPEKTDKPRARPAKGQTVMVGMRWREIKMLSQ